MLEFNKNDFQKGKTMKHTAAKVTADMLNKIEAIEKDVMDLKLSVLKKLTPSGQKVISLKGILKGVEITDRDITDAKQF
jgi:archaellum component FlaC